MRHLRLCSVVTMESKTQSAPKKAGPKLGRSGKKICCSCPKTRKARDNCIVMKGAEGCFFEIEAHKSCLRLEGFDVK